MNRWTLEERHLQSPNFVIPYSRVGNRPRHAFLHVVKRIALLIYSAQRGFCI